MPRPGAQEQIDNEKYEFKNRHWEDYEEYGPKAGQSIAPYLALINRIRAGTPGAALAAEPAVPQRGEFQRDGLLEVPGGRRRTGHMDDTIIVVANLDPHQNQATWFHLNMPELGLGWDDSFRGTRSDHRSDLALVAAQLELARPGERAGPHRSGEAVLHMTDIDPARNRQTRARRGLSGRAIGGLIIAALVIVFIAINRHQTEVSFLFFTARDCRCGWR